MFIRFEGWLSFFLTLCSSVSAAYASSAAVFPISSRLAKHAVYFYVVLIIQYQHPWMLCQFTWWKLAAACCFQVAPTALFPFGLLFQMVLSVPVLTTCNAEPRRCWTSATASNLFWMHAAFWSTTSSVAQRGSWNSTQLYWFLTDSTIMFSEKNTSSDFDRGKLLDGAWARKVPCACFVKGCVPDMASQKVAGLTSPLVSFVADFKATFEIASVSILPSNSMNKCNASRG